MKKDCHVHYAPGNLVGTVLAFLAGMTHQLHPIVLHIDDDPDDRLLVAEAIKKIDPHLQTAEACDGTEGLKYLHTLKEQHKIPCLAIIDMNMPGLTGKEVIEKIKEDPVLKSMPVILLSTSCFTPGDHFFANERVKCITKPTSIDLLESTMREVLQSCEFH